jgi:hypothetical protein
LMVRFGEFSKHDGLVRRHVMHRFVFGRD